jgi:hypothetical protein
MLSALWVLGVKIFTNSRKTHKAKVVKFHFSLYNVAH